MKTQFFFKMRLRVTSSTTDYPKGLVIEDLAFSLQSTLQVEYSTSKIHVSPTH